MSLHDEFDAGAFLQRLGAVTLLAKGDNDVVEGLIAVVGEDGNSKGGVVAAVLRCGWFPHLGARGAQQKSPLYFCLGPALRAGKGPQRWRPEGRATTGRSRGDTSSRRLPQGRARTCSLLARSSKFTCLTKLRGHCEHDGEGMEEEEAKPTSRRRRGVCAFRTGSEGKPLTQSQQSREGLVRVTAAESVGRPGTKKQI